MFNLFKRREEEQREEEYIELDFGEQAVAGHTGKVNIQVESLEDYADSDRIQRKVREGSVVLMKIKTLKEKDMNELKRAIGRIRKTCLAINGDIAGVSNEWVILTPSFAKIHREGPENEAVAAVSASV